MVPSNDRKFNFKSEKFQIYKRRLYIFRMNRPHLVSQGLAKNNNLTKVFLCLEGLVLTVIGKTVPGVSCISSRHL
jgi:hypothetical protein